MRMLCFAVYFLIIPRNFLQIKLLAFACEKWICSLSFHLFHHIWQINFSLEYSLLFCTFFISQHKNYRLLLLNCIGVCVLLVFHQLNLVLLTNLSLSGMCSLGCLSWFLISCSPVSEKRSQATVNPYLLGKKKNNNDCNKTNFWRHLLQVYFLYSSSKAP